MRNDMRIGIDFDGVMHSYQGAFESGLGAPFRSASRFVDAVLAAGHRVFVCSSRAASPDGHAEIDAWIRRHGFPSVEITHEKWPADIYLDDRAFRFTGTFPTVEEIERLRPWGLFGREAERFRPECDAAVSRLRAAMAHERTLLVLCGPPGLGKSTYARRIVTDYVIEDAEPPVVVESDAFWAALFPGGYVPRAARFGYESMKNAIAAHLVRGARVIFDSTALTRHHRAHALLAVDAAKSVGVLGIRTVAGAIRPDIEKSIERRPNIPRERLREMTAKYEEPDTAEGFDECVDLPPV